MRQLLWMAEGRCRQSWAHTSAVMALIANVNRDAKKHRPYRAEDFNPCIDRPAREGVVEINRETVGLMRAAFTGQKGHTR